MNRKRIRIIINQKLKEKYFKNINSPIEFIYWIMMCPNRKYVKKIMNQSRDCYDELRNQVDGI